jgi:hypothetical protein
MQAFGGPALNKSKQDKRWSNFKFFSKSSSFPVHTSLVAPCVWLMRLGRYLVVLVSLCVVIFSSTAPVSMSFTCLAACNKQFSKRAGLNRHQNDCAVYKTSLRLKIECRRVLSQKEKIAGSLDERKARINNIVVNATLYDKRNSNVMAFCAAECWSRI